MTQKLTTCYACGHGKFRLWLAKFICKVFGHRKPEVCTIPGRMKLAECPRCDQITIALEDPNDAEMLNVLFEQHSEWRSKQKLPA